MRRLLGSKGGRQFWPRRYQGSDSLLGQFLVFVLTALVAAVAGLVIAWILA